MVQVFRSANTEQKKETAWARVAERLEESGVDGCLGRSGEECRKKMEEVDRSYSRSGGGGPYAAEVMALAAAPLFALQPPVVAYEEEEAQVVAEEGGQVEGDQVIAGAEGDQVIAGGEAGLVVGAEEAEAAEVLLLLKAAAARQLG